MAEITLSTAHGGSDIQIQKGLLKTCGSWLREEFLNSRFVVVTDENLLKVFGEVIHQNFPNALVLTIPSGEDQKSIQNIERLTHELLKAGIGRKDVLVSIGGGVVTDLAGFLASIYMRGIRYVAIPTSLLGMVDAAIGGKTGIDLGAKNILGSTYLPKYVLIDPELLETLPKEQVRLGMGEVIKYSLTLDSSLLKDFETTPLPFEIILQKSVEAKVKVVSQDLLETDLRKVLNYGHTFGHAIEAASDYKIPHGEAISIGMAISNHVAQKLGKQEPETGKKAKAVFAQFNLPTNLPDGMTIESLAPYLRNDKKKLGDQIDYIIAPKIGEVEIIKIKPDELVELAKDFS